MSDILLYWIRRNCSHSDWLVHGTHGSPAAVIKSRVQARRLSSMRSMQMVIPTAP